jgi:hypothetical protein
MGEMLVRDQKDIDAAIAAAEGCGILIDKRDEIKKGPGEWPTHPAELVLGQCCHQNGSPNFTNWKNTAEYPTRPGNHLGKDGRALPGGSYDIMIPDIKDMPAVVTANFLDRKYEQGNRNMPGSENVHLIAVLIMGGYTGPGFKGFAAAPSAHQLHNLELVTHWLQHIFGYGNEGIFGHYHFGKAACPGDWGIAWIDDKRVGCKSIDAIADWQKALLRWDSDCLPKYGADGDWGNESRAALRKFQRAHGIQVSGFQDDFSELMLMRVTNW